MARHARCEAGRPSGGRRGGARRGGTGGGTTRRAARDANPAGRRAPVAAALAGAGQGTGPAAGLVAMDRYNQGVACALTLGAPFGTGRIIPGTGIVAAADGTDAGIGGPAVLVNMPRQDTRMLVVASAAGGTGTGVAAFLLATAGALDDRPVADSAVVAYG